MRQRTKQIKSWNDLVDFIESINRFKETIVLSGWTNEPVGDTYRIRSLLFTTKPADILIDSYDIVAVPMRKKKNGKHNTKPKGKGTQIAEDGKR